MEGSLTAEEFELFKCEAVHALVALNEECERTFRISSWARWDYDLDASTLTFSQDGVPKVIAAIQVVGTTSSVSKTWLWSWANESIPQCASKSLRQIQEFGKAYGLSQLTQPSRTDDEHLGWAMTAIAARTIKAKGYRCPGANGFIYFVYTDIRFAANGDDVPVIRLPEKREVKCDSHEKASRRSSVNICLLTRNKNGFRSSRTKRIPGQMLGAPNAMPSSSTRTGNGMKTTRSA